MRSIQKQAIEDLPVRVYSPESSLKKPGLLVRDLYDDICSSWELAVALARRDISAMYRQSFLGYIWAFLPVLGTTGVFLFLRSGGAFSTGESNVPYPVYILVGSVLWQVFVDAVNGPLKMINSSRMMLMKINFPRESLVVAAMLMTLFNFVVRLIILIPALIYFSFKNQFDFEITSLVAFPVGVAGLIVLGYSIGMIITPVGMLYKDVQMGVGVLLGFWMFLSPVVMQFQDAKGILREFMMWNPASTMIDTTRAWLAGVEPQFTGFWIVLGLASALLTVGWILYRIALPHVIARMGM